MRVSAVVGLAVGGALFSGAALAKPAECFTTDDGYYDCDFQATDGEGSFVITAPGKPTFEILIDQPGVASGFANFGDRNVSLPGTFVRESNDGACWANTDTGTKICAW